MHHLVYRYGHRFHFLVWDLISGSHIMSVVWCLPPPLFFFFFSGQLCRFVPQFILISCCFPAIP